MAYHALPAEQHPACQHAQYSTPAMWGMASVRGVMTNFMYGVANMCHQGSVGGVMTNIRTMHSTCAQWLAWEERGQVQEGYAQVTLA